MNNPLSEIFTTLIPSIKTTSDPLSTTFPDERIVEFALCPLPRTMTSDEFCIKLRPPPEILRTELSRFSVAASTETFPVTKTFESETVALKLTITGCAITIVWLVHAAAEVHKMPLLAVLELEVEVNRVAEELE